MTYQITHRTSYSYDSEVSASYGQLHLLPRDTPDQRVLSTDVRIDPLPDDYRTEIDFFGNRCAYFAVLRAHTALTVTISTLVDVDADLATTTALAASRPWEQVRDELMTTTEPDGLDARQFVLDSPSATVSAALADYAAPSFPPGRPILEAALDLNSRIHRDFEYKPGATTTRTTGAEVLDIRKGVCQDFSHLGIGCLRSLGLAARYVSGYLETLAPPGRPKLQGADVSHAWFSIFLPAAGWVGLDPTNDCVAGGRHITTAWGRDYADVPPLKGVIYSRAKKNGLKVSVDVVQLPAA